MMTIPAEHEPTHITRPLKMLVPLIREDLQHASQAAAEAAEPYYRAAGEKLIEAKSQMARGDFEPWIKHTFKISPVHARRYMGFARATADRENDRVRAFSSFSEYMREEGGDPGYGKVTRKKDWHDPVKQVIDRVNLEALRQESLKRAEERQLQHRLALQLIDIGYKALATKLHPDKGGSREAMARLNAVRNRLKGAA
jgi:hypothetical protein